MGLEIQWISLCVRGGAASLDRAVVGVNRVGRRTGRAGKQADGGRS